MKIIRPEQPIKKQLLDEMTTISQECKLYDEPQINQGDDILVDNNTYKVKEVEPTEKGVDLTIENLMDEIIKQKDNKIQVTISLTKRQYELYLKKGGESWFKKALTGQNKKGKKKCK